MAYNITTTQSGKRYSFPSVNITETIVGPPKTEVDWRRTLGIAGEFSKGPALAKVTDRQQFITLFGEDNSPGSIMVQQAMLQGADDFYISRAMPVPSKSQGCICFVDPTATPGIDPVVDPSVAYSPQRTTGITIDFSIITDPNPSPTNFYGIATTSEGLTRELDVLTNTEEETSLNVDGYLEFRIQGVEQVNITALMDQGLFTVGDSTNSVYMAVDNPAENGEMGYHYLTWRAAKPNDSNPTAPGYQHSEVQVSAAGSFLDLLRPGLRLVDANPSSPVIESDGLHIHSYPTLLSDGSYKILVKGQIGTAPNTVTELEVSADTMTNYSVPYTVLAVSYKGLDEASMPGTPITINDLKSGDLPANLIDYMLFSEETIGIRKEIEYLSLNADGSFQRYPVGVKFGFGGSSDINKISITDTVDFTIQVLKTTVQAGNVDGDIDAPDAFPPGYSTEQILNELRLAILNNYPLSYIIDTADVTTFDIPYTLTFSTKARGSVANLLKYRVNQVANGTATDIGIDGTFGEWVNMVGGKDGVTPARMYLFDDKGNPLVYIEAVSPGSQGNNITVSISPTSAGTYNLDVSYPRIDSAATPLANERYSLSNYAIDTTSGVYVDTMSSKLIRAFFIPAIEDRANVAAGQLAKVPVRRAPVDYSLAGTGNIDNVLHPNHKGGLYLRGLKLTGGSDGGGDITTYDYLEAIRRLETEDVALIGCDRGIVGDSRYVPIVDALVEQALNSTTYNGLRIAVLGTPPLLSRARADLLDDQFNTPRVVIIKGHAQINGRISTGRNQPPIGLYMGAVTQMSPHISPAAIGNVVGIRSLYETMSLDDLDYFTNSYIECLHRDPVTGVPKFLNGRTTDNSLNNKWVSLRRYGDHLIMKLFRNLQWAKSQNNTPDLRARVASACDAILATELAIGRLQSFTPTIADETINKPADIANGNLNVLVQYVPFFPADYINVHIVRSYSAQFSLQLGE